MAMQRRTVLAASAGALLPLPAMLSRAAAAQAGPAVLRVVTPWEISSLEPSRAGYVFTRMQVSETLVGADNGGLPKPGLAASWAVSGDRLSWLFTLRESATFHDGTLVTAEAAAAALRRAKAQPGPFSTAPVTAIEAPDPRTVVLRTSQPLAAMPAFLAHSATQILAPSSYDDAGAVRRVVGSGPYRVRSMDPPLRMEVERFDAWSGGPRPAIERVTYSVVPRAETRAVMAESGQADLVFILDPPGQDRLRRARRVDLRTQPIPRTQVIKLNAGLPFFDDVRERRAISLLVDRDGISRAVLRNPGNAAAQMFAPTLAEWHVPALPPLKRDVAEARRLLAECGWVPGANGTLEQEGKPFRVTLRTFSDRPELPVSAAALQENLREAGIDMQVAVANSSEIPAGHRDGSLEMALFSRSFSILPDPIGTLRVDFGVAGGDWGAMGWSDAALIAALDQLGGTSDPIERGRLRSQVASILHGQLPVIPVAWYDNSVSVSRRLAGVSVDPLELSYRIADMRWTG